MNEEPTRLFGLRENLATLFRHKGKIATIFLVTVLVAGLGSFLPSKVYQADARILLHQNRQALPVTAVLTQAPGERPTEPGDLIRTEVEIFKSPAVVSGVVDQLGAELIIEKMTWRWDWLKELPSQLLGAVVDWVASWSLFADLFETMELGRGGEISREKLAALILAAHLDAEPIRQTDVFQVALKSPDPHFAAKALNSALDLYLDHHLNVRQGQGAASFFAEEAERLAKQLHEAKVKLQAFKAKWGIVSLSAQKQLLLQRLSEAESDFQRAQIEAKETEQRIAEIQVQLRRQTLAIPLTSVSTRNPMLDQLRSKLMKLEVERSQYSDDSDAVVQLEREISMLRANMKAEEAKVSGSQTTGVNSIYQELQKTVALEKSKLKALEKRLELDARIEAYQNKLQLLDDHEVEYQELDRDVKIKEEALQLYLRKQEESRVNSVLNRKKISNVTPLSRASVPLKAIRPNKKLNLAIGIVVGLFGGIAFAYLLEFFRRTFATKEEVEERLGCPVLASFGRFDDDLESMPDGVTELRRLAEAVNRARREDGVRSLLVTSSLAGEGKSYLSKALAKTLSNEGIRTLLVDGEYFETSDEPPEPSDSFEKMSTEPKQSQLAKPESTSNPNLDILKTGRRSLSKTDTCRHYRQMEKLIDALNGKGRYDFLIIDGPAINSDPEVLRLTTKVKAVLLVIQADRAPTFTVEEVVENLKQTKASILGTVLNGRRYVIPRWIYSRFLSPRRGAAYA